MSTSDPQPAPKPKLSKEQLAELIKQMIPDARLRQAIEQDPNQVCELIVEANLPSRKFGGRKGTKGPGFLGSLVAESTEDDTDPDQDQPTREEALEDLQRQLNKLAIEHNSKVLRAAGAVVTRVLAKQLPTISTLPGVKQIRPNRQLKPQGN